ncbi:uncharacterized protein EV422DRAFT_622466 [Fimicolochytrium jonesii]|uniref:uncharacterized protein n=1 Tax=Fimicolochytrium jonesii TaxID=1396493 RepID=UPI0022FE5B98|nr:uncharacterized protein EV422DRAFT_622466 [Fimicolochytrium jonesii]KAI8817497.1 hypothetical protein EV422DRAFT_622466 [Fimicolochytrium jonesii]
MLLNEVRFLDITTVRYSPVDRVLILLLLLVNLGACLGNAFLIYLFCTDKKLRNPATYLVLNLAIIDLCLGSVNAFCFFAPNLITGKFYLGFVGGQINGYAEVMFCGASLINLGLLGFDRWLVIVRNYRISTKQAFYLAALSWVWGIILASVPFWFGNHHILEYSRLYFAGDWSNQSPGGLVMTIGCLFTVSMPLLWFTYSYAQILHVVRQNNRQWAQLQQHGRGKDRKLSVKPDQRSLKDLKAAQLEAAIAKRSAIVVGVFVINWLFYLVNFLAELTTGRQFNGTLDTFAVFGAHLNSFFNPDADDISKESGATTSTHRSANLSWVPPASRTSIASTAVKSTPSPVMEACTNV